VSRVVLGALAPAWLLLGVGALFTSAVVRLGARGLATLQGGLSAGHWVVLISLTAVMVYGEGVVALQRRWVPRLLRRARALRGESLGLKLLGPLYGLSLVGAPGKQLLRGWLGTLAIVTAILIVRSLPEPWRGIVDFSVASALAWGLLSIAWGSPTAFRSADAEPAPETVARGRDSGGEACAPNEVHGDHDAREIPEERHARQVERGIREEP
jgi:hypothetical protein